MVKIMSSLFRTDIYLSWVLYKKNLTAVYWRSIILDHNYPPSGTTATYEKLLPFRKDDLALGYFRCQ